MNQVVKSSEEALKIALNDEQILFKLLFTY